MKWFLMKDRLNSGRFMVKICGITNFEDGKLAYNLGADMLGVVRSKESPRFAENTVIEELKTLGVPVVGVYTDLSQVPDNPEEDFVQLHFNHTDQEIDNVKLRGVGTISVIQFETFTKFLEKYESYKLAGTNLIMLESKEGIMKLKNSLLHLSMMYDFGISGGISYKDIPEILTIKPKFIDLSSSLEKSPGKKDPEKMKKFFSDLEVRN